MTKLLCPKLSFLVTRKKNTEIGYNNKLKSQKFVWHYEFNNAYWL